MICNGSKKSQPAPLGIVSFDLTRKKTMAGSLLSIIFLIRMQQRDCIHWKYNNQLRITLDHLSQAADDKFFESKAVWGEAKK